jgi:signal transduction histidine kinase
MSSGLWDAGAGITVGGRHIANWLIGQVRDETQTDEYMKGYAREIGADEEAFLKAFHEVPAMPRERFASVARVLYTLANQLSTMAYQNVQQARFISERNRAEKEKESLQAQFQQAQKLESVGRLAGGVAHDLNNLLSPIIGYSEIFLDELEKMDHRREYAQIILEAGVRARDIVRQLLAFSRKQTMELRPIDLNDMLGRFQTLLRRTIREDIHIRMVAAPSLPPVKGDMGQLEQVVMNLVVNAQDAMPDGGALSMETALVTLADGEHIDRLDLTKGVYVMLAISDTGHGMDEETRQNIFEPFFSTKGEHGTGLGLATVYGIVKQHHGGIWVYSEPGKGTTFKIYLPAIDGAVAEKSASESGEARQGSETILLVEDNDQVRKMTANILSRRGYQVFQAENGKNALKLLEARADGVALLLTDVVMPEMNGKDLYLKAVEINPDIRVLYMSGYTDDVIAHRGVLEAGVNFIQKPFSVRGLTTKIREVLDPG